LVQCVLGLAKVGQPHWALSPEADSPLHLRAQN